MRPQDRRQERKTLCQRGELLAGRPGRERDYQKAGEYLEKGCQLGYTEACNKAGEMHEHGTGFPQDVKKARELYKKACDLGNDEGCALSGKVKKSGV